MFNDIGECCPELKYFEVDHFAYNYYRVDPAMTDHVQAEKDVSALIKCAELIRSRPGAVVVGEYRLAGSFEVCSL